MNRHILVVFVLLILPFLIACGGGGSDPFSPEPGANMYGYTFATDTTIPNKDVRAIHKLASSNTILVGAGDGLYSFDQYTFPPTYTKSAGLNVAVNCLVKESTGDILIGTDNGLYRRTSTTGAIALVTGSPVQVVLSVSEEKAGTFWLGLQDKTATTNSVARIEGGTATTWGTAKGMTASEVVCIFAAEDLIMACGLGDTGKAGLFQYSKAQDKWTQDPNYPIAAGCTFFERLGSTWYAGGPDGGLWQSSDYNAWTKLVADVTPRQIVSDATSGVNVSYTRYWLATEEGLYLSYDLSKFVLYNKASNGLHDDNCRSVTPWVQGVWTVHPGAAGGLTRGAFTAN